MKLRFFMSCRRKNLVRDKVIGKKWINLERYTFHRRNKVCLKRQEQPQGMGTSRKVRGAVGETHSTDACGPSQKVRDPEICG